MKLADPLTIEVHPPERLRRTEIRICHGCCCCCCCLHTIGGIIGAAVAPTLGKKRQAIDVYDDDDEFNIALPSGRKSGMSSAAVFWITTLVAVIIAVMASVVPGFDMTIGLVLLALFLPGVQLGCALVTFFIVVWRPQPERSYQLAQLGKITLGLFLGTVLGIVTMVGVGMIMSVR